MLQCLIRAAAGLAIESVKEGGGWLGGPLVLVTLYEPTSQMRRAPGGTLALSATRN